MATTGYWTHKRKRKVCAKCGDYTRKASQQYCKRCYYKKGEPIPNTEITEWIKIP